MIYNGAVRFVLAILFLEPLRCYITRLPECKYHARFKYKPQRKSDGDVILVDDVNKLTGDDCTRLCLGNDACSHVNYHYKNMICELLSSGTKYHLQFDNTGWAVLEPDYGDYSKLGPVCWALDPCVNYEVCMDDCTEQGYKCVNVNVAPLGTASMSEIFDSTYLAEYAIDNDLNTEAHSQLYSTMPHWWQIDLKKVYTIRIVLLVSGHSYTSAPHSQLKISTDANDWQICVDSIEAASVQIKIRCDMEGQYVRIGDAEDYVSVYDIKILVAATEI